MTSGPRIHKGYRQLVAEAEAEIATVSPQEALRQAESGEAVLVDIRDPRELDREGRIAGAFHAPRGMLEFWVDPESPYHKEIFASRQRFIFFCAGGMRSALATKTVRDMGLENVAHVAGGFGAWRAAGLSIEPPESKG